MDFRFSVYGTRTRSRALSPFGENASVASVVVMRFFTATFGLDFGFASFAVVTAVGAETDAVAGSGATTTAAVTRARSALRVRCMRWFSVGVSRSSRDALDVTGVSGTCR